MSVLRLSKSSFCGFSTKSSNFLEDVSDVNIIRCPFPSIIMPSRSSVFCVHLRWKVVFNKVSSFTCSTIDPSTLLKFLIFFFRWCMKCSKRYIHRYCTWPPSSNSLTRWIVRCSVTSKNDGWYIFSRLHRITGMLAFKLLIPYSVTALLHKSRKKHLSLHR